MKSHKLICNFTFVTLVITLFTFTCLVQARGDDLETLALRKIEKQKTPRIIQVPMYSVQFPSKPLPGVKYPLFVPQESQFTPQFMPPPSMQGDLFSQILLRQPTINPLELSLKPPTS